MFDQGMTNMPNFDFNSSVLGDNNVVDNNMNVDINMMNYAEGQTMQGSYPSNPINEAVQERVVNRTFVHEVPQD